MTRFLLTFALLTTFTLNAEAKLTESWKADFMPDRDSISRWNQSPIEHELTITLWSVTLNDLQALKSLKGLKRLTLKLATPLELGRNEEKQAWMALAQATPLVIAIENLPVPANDVLETLNQLPLKGVQFNFNYYPDTAEMARLHNLKHPLAVHFSAAKYPIYDDREMFEAMPLNLDLTLSADYWPWYTQMDLFNMIPQALRLEVRDSLPDSTALEYLRNIHRLKELVVETDQEPNEGDFWSTLQIKAPVVWKTRDYAPDEAALNRFTSSLRSSGASLWIQSDIGLSLEELRMYDQSSVNVTWAHAAP